MNFINSFRTFILALILSIGVSYAYAAWAPPSTTPTGGNTDAPVNVGSATQVKAGALTVNGLLTAVSNLVVNGNVGIGVASPGAKLHVGGTAGTDGIMFPDGTLQKTAAGGGSSSVNWDDIVNMPGGFADGEDNAGAGDPVNVSNALYFCALNACISDNTLDAQGRPFCNGVISQSPECRITKSAISGKTFVCSAAGTVASCTALGNLVTPVKTRTDGYYLANGGFVVNGTEISCVSATGSTSYTHRGRINGGKFEIKIDGVSGGDWADANQVGDPYTGDKDSWYLTKKQSLGINGEFGIYVGDGNYQGGKCSANFPYTL